MWLAMRPALLTENPVKIVMDMARADLWDGVQLKDAVDFIPNLIHMAQQIIKETEAA